jgi:hypothetical protein
MCSTTQGATWDIEEEHPSDDAIHRLKARAMREFTEGKKNCPTNIANIPNPKMPT